MKTHLRAPIDAYWTRESDRAYDERRRNVRDMLKVSGGVAQPWMGNVITRDHLAEELAPYAAGP